MADPLEVAGVNDRRQLAALEGLFRSRTLDALMTAGVASSIRRRPTWTPPSWSAAIPCSIRASASRGARRWGSCDIGTGSQITDSSSGIASRFGLTACSTRPGWRTTRRWARSRASGGVPDRAECGHRELHRDQAGHHRPPSEGAPRGLHRRRHRGRGREHRRRRGHVQLRRRSRSTRRASAPGRSSGPTRAWSRPSRSATMPTSARAR